MKTIFFIIFSLFNLPLFAQVKLDNIIAGSGMKRILPEQFIEYKGSYYFLSVSYKDTVCYPIIGYEQYKPTQVYLHKVNKLTNALTATYAIAGDTIQADSIVDAESCYFCIENNHVHIAFRNIYVTGTINYNQLHHSVQYLQIDTNLNNILVSERQLVYDDNSRRINNVWVAGIATTANKVTIICAQADSVKNNGGRILTYKQMDMGGNIVKEGPVGAVDTTATTTQEQYLFHFTEMDSKYLVSGYGIVSKNQDVFCIRDEHMNHTDSGFLSIFFTLKNESVGTYRPLEVIPLPNSPYVILGGGVRRDIDSNATMFYHTAFVKYKNENNNPTIERSLIIMEQDSEDREHFDGYELSHKDQHLAYNKSENLIYYANAAYTNHLGGICYKGYNYLQIICADTNLNLKWRKFIFSGIDSCMWVRTVKACHERTGVVVVGRTNGISNMLDTSLQVDFAYRIDSDGYVSVNDAEKQMARNRIEIYPNPATDKVTIDDVFNGGGTYYLYNMQGKLLDTARYDRFNKTVVLQNYPPGLYLVRVICNDDETYNFKIQHQ